MKWNIVKEVELFENISYLHSLQPPSISHYQQRCNKRKMIEHINITTSSVYLKYQSCY